MSFKIFKFNCCGLDVHKTWIYACIGITDSNNRTEYKQSRFSSFTKGLNELCDWLAKYNCKDVCMESTGKDWIPLFNSFQRSVVIGLSSPQQNTSSPGQDAVPEMIKATAKSNPLGFPVLVPILNQF